MSYATKTSDQFSIVTTQMKPYSKMPPICKHDYLLDCIKDQLVNQILGAKTWPGTVSSARHAVLNTYAISRSTKKWLQETPNLFQFSANQPEDICFYRKGVAWLITTTHEEIASLVAPTQDDLLFFEI